MFDELDALAPERESHPTFLQLAFWVMDFLNLHDAGLTKSIIIGITNNPFRVDPAVIRRLPFRLYFDAPSEKVVAEILEHGNIPQPLRVAHLLCERLGRDGRRSTGSGTAEAARLAVAYYKFYSIDIGTLSAEQLAEFMVGAAGSVSEQELDAYRNRYHAEIAKSHWFLDRWPQLALP